MQLLDRRTQKATSLLTKLAFGDVTLVRDALAKHGDDDVDKIIAFIRARRDPSRGPGVKTPAAG
jgi:hypothetical protein